MSTSSGRKNRRIAFSIGLLITGLTVLAYSLGLLDRLERQAYDAQFMAGASAGDSGQIIHIDIDDGSLEEIGRWPWPRAKIADVVDVLSELDAGSIVLDIIMPEPQEPRLADSPYGKHYDLIGAERFLVEQRQFVEDDRVLSDAIRRSGRVFVSMHFEPEDPSHPATRAPDQTPANLLTGEGPAYVRRRVAEFLREQPNARPAEVAHAIYEQAATEAGPYQDLIFNCYRQCVALRAMERCSVGASSPMGGADWSRAANAVAPIPAIAEAAAGTGFVYFKPDPDGTMRAIPPMMQYEGRVYPQLALLVASRQLDVPLDRVRAEPHRIVLPQAKLPDGGRGDLLIPLDDQNRMLINWDRPTAAWHEAFKHLSVRGLLAIVRNRQLIQEKQNQLTVVGEEAVRRAFAQSSAELTGYAKAAKVLRDRAGLAALSKDQRDAAEALAKAQMVAYEDSAREILKLQHAALRAAQGSELTADQRATLQWLEDVGEPLFEPSQVQTEISNLRRTIAIDLDSLRPFVRDKICFVGSTATGASDFVLTPAFPQCPGVVVHSNILNTILTGQFIQPAPAWLNVLAIVLCGLLATAITAGVGPRLSVVLVLATMAAVAAFNMLVLFAQWRLWMVLAGPLLLVVMAWGFIVLYRWLTEARQRRWVMSALASYTSPAVANRISEHPDLLALKGEERVITCMFTDLKGFTPISERLGPERTVALLNRYLDRMSEVLLRYEATISKFMGDGIFAFFGAPDVRIDHARRSAGAALDCREELRQFCRELDTEGAPQLAMRIGIATGPAIFGNCGSSRKLDYTAIGDTVNLASRLEGANKFFGTWIMVSGAAADELDPEFLLRPLGRIVVVGKGEAVPVFELVDRMSESADADRCWADGFGAAVRLYSQRQFDAALAAFETLRTDRPTDKPTAIYIDRCRAAIAGPVAADWSDAIVLTEK
ncbi:MAG: adenylate/guanylate cyclase domain-containing protein [Phycisphaerae bacterium]|nr:adenylate/guanylate cyclase domain-containing protein [Phycisphaerae bacterium]